MHALYSISIRNRACKKQDWEAAVVSKLSRLASHAELLPLCGSGTNQLPAVSYDRPR